MADDDDPLVRAVANLVTAVGTSLLVVSPTNTIVLSSFLDTLDMLNAGLPAGPVKDAMTHSTQVHRVLLIGMAK